MRRRTHRRWILVSQLLIVVGLGLAALWNVASLALKLEEPVWWASPALALPGLLAWAAASAVPLLLPKMAKSRKWRSFRLTYDTGPDWDDVRFRRALLNMIRVGGGMDMIWARDGHELGCWLLLPGDGRVLRRLIGDLLPGGAIEEEPFPAVGEGVVILRRRKELPAPELLCRMDGVAGVCFRWLSDTSAAVALWGPGAEAAARQFAGRGDLLPGRGDGILYPAFVGDNPWPELPALPSSGLSPGLSSVSRLELVAPALRLKGGRGIALGRDAERKVVGFSLPDLEEVRSPLRVYGQATAQIVTGVARQAIQARMPVVVMDGEGGLAASLARELLREVSAGRVLVCDVERPAQSRFRLNPLWLPADRAVWPRVFSGGWMDWLRELGVTPGGLGLEAYRHTQVAVVLTALLAAGRGLTLDAPALCEALETPDFLSLAGGEVGGPAWLGAEIWQWWLARGRPAPNFDAHLRLAHLRDRLNALLGLPEYRVLWRAPYLDPLAMTEGVSLVWRLPDPRRRLRGYITSQLLALSSLLAAWPQTLPPVVVLLHELDVEAWAGRLAAFPGARLILSARSVGARPVSGSLLLSRLEREDAERMRGGLPGVRTSDLRRLPGRRLLWRRGAVTGTFDMLD